MGAGRPDRDPRGVRRAALPRYATYKDEPPIPKRVLSPSGQVLFTGSDVTSGQKVFLSNGLMEFGSIFGHGA